MTSEREAKLSVPEGFVLPPFEGLPGRVEARPDPVWQTFGTAYLDTPDLRLASWGCSLRFREGQGWTVKLPPARDGVLLIRDEHRFDGPAGRPPAAAVDLVRAFVRTGSLAPVVRLRTERTRIGLAGPDGRDVAEVVDDDVRVLEGRREASRFREVEVEIAEGAPEDLLPAALAVLGRAGARPVDPPVTKYARALGDRMGGVSPQIGETKPGADPSVGDLVGSALWASVTRMIVHDPEVRLAEDPEGVHQARVATRRLRSDLRTFGPVLDPAWAGRLRDELARYADVLGTARDADVLMDVLATAAASLQERDEPVAARLIDRLRRQRAGFQDALLAAMRSRRYLTLLDDLVVAADTPAVLPEVAGRPARSLGPLMERPWKHLEHAASGAGTFPADADLHEIRIRAKRARYAAEALIPAFGKPARRFGEAAAELQTVLGRHQDAVIASAWLRDEAGRAAAATAFVAGELAGLQQAIARDTRDEWRDVWARLDRRKLRFWA
ncbi:MAG: CYTH and CHAD domain-containing protein [Actinomycetota bacterium]